ncbi:MAG: ABC transporter permease [Acidobacteria bacterium]|nr:ABC transporter permease [Acidobacteriota bacterium]
MRSAAMRVMQIVPALWASATLVWVFMFIIPGDPARLLSGQSADPEVLKQVRAEWGLDRPPLERYLAYLRKLASGDLGRSYVQRRPVVEILREALGRTVVLAISATAIAITAGILLGALAASKRGAIGGIVGTFTTVGLSLPTFWLGLMLMIFFAANLGWFPISGMGERMAIMGLDFPSPRHLALPALTLAIFPASMVARVTRASLLEQKGSGYLRAARARGLSPSAILWRHAFPNALGPALTLAGLVLASLLGGAVATEMIFAWPGIGRAIFDALGDRDLPVVEGGVLLLTTIFLVVNFAVDLVHASLDPRARS